MIERTGDRVTVSGRVTVTEAESLLEAGRKEILGPKTAIDLGGITEADSSALAVLFGWAREAAARNVQLEYLNAPANLLSLAEVYGVSDFLPRR